MITAAIWLAWGAFTWVEVLANVTLYGHGAEPTLVYHVPYFISSLAAILATIGVNR